jgi:heme-degrading monooxygenase HmoA
MYGTIARMQLKPGAEAELRRRSREEAPELAGYAFHHVFRTDANPNEIYLVVAFESKEAYTKNAASPEQHQRYQGYRELLTAEPEWHDGEIIDSYPDEGS